MNLCGCENGVNAYSLYGHDERTEKRTAEFRVRGLPICNLGRNFLQVLDFLFIVDLIYRLR